MSQGIGNTANYRYISIQIEDAHPSLTEHKVILKGDGLQRAIKLQIEHHNWGDRMEITLPNVTYTFQASGGNVSSGGTAQEFKATYPNGDVFTTADIQTTPF